MVTGVTQRGPGPRPCVSKTLGKRAGGCQGLSHWAASCQDSGLFEQLPWPYFPGGLIRTRREEMEGNAVAQAPHPQTPGFPGTFCFTEVLPPRRLYLLLGEIEGHCPGQASFIFLPPLVSSAGWKDPEGPDVLLQSSPFQLIANK